MEFLGQFVERYESLLAFLLNHLVPFLDPPSFKLVLILQFLPLELPPLIQLALFFPNNPEFLPLLFLSESSLPVVLIHLLPARFLNLVDLLLGLNIGLLLFIPQFGLLFPGLAKFLNQQFSVVLYRVLLLVLLL